jgi:hypothetical protein
MLVTIGILSLSLVVIAGWKLESVFLTQIHSNYPAMQFNTALCFGLAGLALLFLEFKIKLTTKFAAVWLGLLSGSTLLQYLTGLNFGIDLLFHENPFIVQSAAPVGWRFRQL